MNCKVYACFDSVAENTVAIFNAVNDGMAIRDNAQFLARICPLKDMKLFEVGSYSEADKTITPTSPAREVDWASYKLPRSNVPNLSENKKITEANAQFQKDVFDLANK